MALDNTAAAIRRIALVDMIWKLMVVLLEEEVKQWN